MGARIQLRRGKKAFWESENPILHEGEPGYERDTRKLKIGDGVTPWRDLPYAAGGATDIPVDQASLAEHINAATPHPVYDSGPSLSLLYQNAKV
jgi:Major tropism determinant N-terminal domain